MRVLLMFAGRALWNIELVQHVECFKENPLVLSKALPQIRRVNMNILADGLIPRRDGRPIRRLIVIPARSQFGRVV